MGYEVKGVRRIGWSMKTNGSWKRTVRSDNYVGRFCGP